MRRCWWPAAKRATWRPSTSSSRRTRVVSTTSACACWPPLRRRKTLPRGPSSPPPPEEGGFRRGVSRHIQDGLMKLPHDQRAAVVLCDVQGLSYDEIAQTLAVSGGTGK